MNLNPIVLSIPIFFLLMGIEIVMERISHRKLYRLNDSVANLSCGITSQLSGLFMRILAIGVYALLYENFALFELKENWLYWIALFLLADLAYYWAHRMSHEINVFWGGHVVHHQSEEYNLSVALRQSSFQVVWTFAFSLPLAIIGFETLDFALMSALITLYQFWIHTELINKMGWFEYIFNTPSHHRVHHGRNPKYIDKNHAGTLIIWDKMFGTFQAEEERPTYGITKPINSWNPIWANFSHYADMGKDLKRITRWSDRIKYLFKKPGWLPDYLGGIQAVPEIDQNTYKKYDQPNGMSLNLYVLFQYVLSIVGTALFLFNTTKFTMPEKAFIAILISIVVVNCGVLFENKPWVKISEWLRIILYPALLAVIVSLYNYSFWLYVLAGVYFIISALWFGSITKQHLGRDAKSCASVLIIMLLISGCGKDLPAFEGFDLEQWKKDKNACGTYRTQNLENFKAQKEKLLALKEMQIVNLLGRPDKNELYKRNQKFYYYNLKPSPDCSGYNPGDNARLAIRFNAMGLAKEVMVE